MVLDGVAGSHPRPQIVTTGAEPSPLMQPQVPVRLPATSAASQKEYEALVAD